MARKRRLIRKKGQKMNDDLLECYESFFEKLAILAVFALILATI